MSAANPQAKATQGDFEVTVKTALVRKRQTVTQLATELNLARNTVSIAINHPSMLPTVKRRIAKHLKLPLP